MAIRSDSANFKHAKIIIRYLYTRSMIKTDRLRDQESNKQRTALETYPEKELYAIRRNLGFAGRNIDLIRIRSQYQKRLITL